MEFNEKITYSLITTHQTTVDPAHQLLIISNNKTIIIIFVNKTTKQLYYYCHHTTYNKQIITKNIIVPMNGLMNLLTKVVLGGTNGMNGKKNILEK